MTGIEVTQWIDRKAVPVCINADLIDYLKPRLAETSVYFLNGASIVIKESPAQLRELIKAQKKRAAY